MPERAKQTTRNGKYAYVEYARFADDLVVLIDPHPRNARPLGAVNKRLREEFANYKSRAMKRRAALWTWTVEKASSFWGSISDACAVKSRCGEALQRDRYGGAEEVQSMVGLRR
jgi:hypothetical protein